ncbi:unnamed protein product [Blumeria hordei]|nr:unnamed protein product [Blumeria hordei]
MQQSGSSSLIITIREISHAPQSILSFWRGTLPSALRTGFGSAIYFTSLNALRQNVSRLRLIQIPGHDNVGNHSSSLPELSNVSNLATGAVARATAGFVLMPMTVLKVRFESNMYAYRSLACAGQDILKREGFKGFFSGFGATAARDAPYAGLYVLLYEQLKRRFSIFTGPICIDEPLAGMNGPKSAFINFSSSMIAAGLATAITNPFDVIKTRIQLQPKIYHNVFNAFHKIIRKDGLKSLSDGLLLRMGRKTLSSALAWTLYEEVIRRAEHRYK